MEINPRDQIIFHNLAALEEAGEKAFSDYYSGDTEAAGQKISHSLNASAKNINSLHDPELRKEAKKLLDVTNQAIREYMKNPSEENLDVLQSDIDTYKGFLNDHQE